ncbi:MAG TPA: radical SAM protein [Candidatus Kapabacteria bacterium]|nr:radical SAM protein [Candidatus Kapabacteria bacterium]
MPLNRPGAPLWATVNITGVCNLECKYCYFQPRKYDHMTIANFKKVVEILKSQKLFFLTISGGEPFLHPQINDILKYAHDEFEYATVLSNGTNIKKENVDCMKEIIKKKGFFPMQVSLDAIDPDTNNKTRGLASKVIKNLEILSEAGVSLTIAIVVTSQNIEQVVKTVIASKHLTNHFHIMPFKLVPFLELEDRYLRSQQPDMQKIWQLLQDARDKHKLEITLPIDDCDTTKYSATGAPCVAGFTQVVIDPDLDVRACSRCTHAVVGNLGQESIESIWNGPRLAYIYNRDVPYCYLKSEWEAALKDPTFMIGKRGVKAA